MALRELHSREADGGRLQVNLLWDDETDKCQVVLVDGRVGTTAHIPVPNGVRPLHVFNHPYAFAEGARHWARA